MTTVALFVKEQLAVMNHMHRLLTRIEIER